MEGASPPQRGELRFKSLLGEVPTFSAQQCLQQDFLK